MTRNKQDASADFVRDVVANREAFFETFFRKGAEFANELIAELQVLRRNADQLQQQNLELRHQLASDDLMRDLLGKVEALESEKHSLRSSMESQMEFDTDFSSRYGEMERQLDELANLYVASYQLHSTLEPGEVLGAIEQLLAQFVGASSFAIYTRRVIEDRSWLVPVHAYHLTEVAGTKLPWGEGPIGEAAESQLHTVSEPGATKPGMPLACIPLLLGEQSIGVIAIFGLFEQKKRFVDLDFELFKLLTLHAASAIVAAGFMARAKSVDESLASYQSL